MEKVIKILRGEIKSIDLENKTVTAIVSHAKKDRDGDIIPPESFKKRLGNYKKHPVLLVDHSYRTEDQIGMAKSVKLNDDHVEATFEYAVGKGNPKADWAFELCKMGLASYSIGFQSYGFDWIEEKDAQGNIRTTGRKFNDIELLEISHVTVPANPMALQASIDNSETSIEEKELCQLVLKGIQDGKIKPSIDTDVSTTEGVPQKQVEEMIAKAIKDVQEQETSQQQGQEARIMGALQAAVSQVEQKINQLQSTVDILANRMDAMEEMERIEDTDGISATTGNLNPPKHYSRKLFGKGTKESKPIPSNIKKLDVAELVKQTIQNLKG